MKTLCGALGFTLFALQAAAAPDLSSLTNYLEQNLSMHLTDGKSAIRNSTGTCILEVSPEHLQPSRPNLYLKVLNPESLEVKAEFFSLNGRDADCQSEVGVDSLRVVCHQAESEEAGEWINTYSVRFHGKQIELNDRLGCDLN